MSFPSETVLAFLGGTGFPWLVAAGLLLAVAIGRHARRRRGSAATVEVWRGAAGLLPALLLWAVFTSLFRLSDLPAPMWTAPLDRLVVVGALVGLGWTLGASERTGDSWHRFLTAGLLAAVLVYAGWAPLWAREVHLRPATAVDPTGLGRAWDLWQAGLAVAVGMVAARRAATVPWWTVAAPAALAAGSAMQALSPLPTAFPAWSRLGALAAGGCILAAAIAQAAALHAPDAAAARRALAGAAGSLVDAWRELAIGRQRWHPARPGVGRASAIAAAGFAAEAVPDLDLDLGADVLVDRALRATASSLGASAALFATLHGDEVELRALPGADSEPRGLGTLPLHDVPTIAHALGTGRVVLDTSRSAFDIQRLLDLLQPGAAGPTLLQRAGDAAPRGVLVARRTRGTWSARDTAEMAAMARDAAAALDAADAQRAARGDIRRVQAALETQASALTRLTRAVEELAFRVEAVEDRIDPSSAAGRAAAGAARIGPARGEAPAQPGATPSAASAVAQDAATRSADDVLAARLASYERALHRLPWGVVVVDAAGAVAFANETGRRLTHADLAPGTPLAAAFPDADRVTAALHRAQQRRAGDATAPEPVELATPSVRLEIDALHDPTVGFVGAVCVVYPAEAPSEGPDADLVQEVISALHTPIRMILGYSDLLSQGPDLTDEQMGRFVHQIDANLARMQVMLANLLTVLQLGRPAAGSRPPELVDLEQALHQAAGRAEAQLAEKSLKVDLSHVGSSLPPASADPIAVHQILDNLLINAAQRSPQGGDISVDVELRDDAGHRALVVAFLDRGGQLPAGMSEIDAVGDAPVVLSIVRLLAAREGGRAWAESHPHGARFVVRLPIRRS